MTHVSGGPGSIGRTILCGGSVGFGAIGRRGAGRGWRRGFPRFGFGLGFVPGFGLGFVPGFDVGFDGWGRHLRAEAFEAVEVFDGMTIEALGLGLEAEEHIGTGGLPNETEEAEGEPIGTMLPEGDVDALGEVGLLENEWDGACHGSW
jgi:hypothetical protein